MNFRKKSLVREFFILFDVCSRAEIETLLFFVFTLTASQFNKVFKTSKKAFACNLEFVECASLDKSFKRSFVYDLLTKAFDKIENGDE